jgi:hypothetical protein
MHIKQRAYQAADQLFLPPYLREDLMPAVLYWRKRLDVVKRFREEAITDNHWLPGHDQKVREVSEILDLFEREAARVNERIRSWQR